MSEPLDAAVRPLFPALARTVDGRPAAFLDGPGGSQAPASVIDAMAAQLRGGTANDGGVFATSRETIELIARARHAAAALTGSAPEEIAFGANMTTLNFLLAHAVARTLERGDEIVVTQLDHDANIAPWVRVADDHGLVVRTAPVTAEATLDVDALEALVGSRTRVVAFTLASNAVGSITDARRIVAAAHAAGALAWADAVHYAPHRRPDRRALGGDVLLCSPYKVFGPHLGIAAIRRDLAETWPADRVRPASEEPPGHRFETGTPSFEALAGLVAAVDYVAGLGSGDGLEGRLDAAYARIGAHEEALTRHVLERLGAIDGVTLHGIADPGRAGERTPTFCFTVDDATPRAVAEHLAARGVFVWDGNYYALALMEALGLEEHGGAVRAGFLHYNTVEEADRLADAVAELAARARPATASAPRRDEAPA
jgi:cysteine desulfurase family protein (TIGR01976 family)